MSEKWWDMSDDELDDLFRDASDKVNVPFESSSFDKLRQKIDIQRKPEPPQGYKNRWLVLLAGLFLVVGVGLVYHFVSKEQSLLIGSKGDNSTKIAGNIEQKHTKQLSNLPATVLSETSSKAEIKEQSTSLKPENLPNNLAISSEKRRKQFEKANPLLPISPETAKKTPPFSVSPQTTGERIASPLSVSPQTTGGEIALANNQRINEGQIKENSRVYDTDKQVDIAKNSKKNTGKKGKNSALNPIILEQNTSPIVENSLIIPEKIASEETVIRTNFYGVNDLKNKNSKSLLTEISTDLPPYIDSLPKVIKSPKLRHFGIRLALSPDINSASLGNYIFKI